MNDFKDNFSFALGFTRPSPIHFYKLSLKFFALFSISAFTARTAVGAEADAEDWTRIYAVESPALSVDGTQLSFTWCNTNWTASATGGIARVSAKPPRPFDAGPFTNEMYAAMGWDYSLSPDATRVAFRFRGDDSFRRRNGTFSSRAGEIWLYDGRTKSYTNLVRRAGNCTIPVWLGNDAIAYLAQDGRGGCEVRHRNLTTGKDAAIIPAGTHDMANFLSAAKMAAPQTGGPRSRAAAYALVVRHGWDLWRYALDAHGNVVDSEMLVFHPETNWNARAAVRNRWYDKNWNNDAAETMAATPDGRDIVFTTGGDLWAVKPGKGTNKVTRLRGKTRSHERNCVLSPDGSIVYYLRDFGDHVEIWGMHRTAPDQPWHRQKRVTNWPVVRSGRLRTRLALSPKGDRLSWVDWAGGFYVASTNASSKIKNYTPPGTHKQWEYAWSPDGRYVAMAAADGSKNVDVWVIPMTGTNAAVNVSDHLMWDGEPQWTTNSAKLVFKARFRRDGETRLFSVDMKKPLRKGGCSLVPQNREAALKAALVKQKPLQVPVFRAEQETNLADYQELAFLTMWARLKARLWGPRVDAVDWDALRAKYLPAARNAPSWRQFRRVMLQMLGELDTSHLNFSANDDARREWSLPKSPKERAKRKVANVEKKRARVHAASHGTWGYVRVGGMKKDDYDAFLVDLHREGRGRAGVILDLRGNTGGSWADSMLDSLMTPPHGWADWQRGGVRGYLPDHLNAPHFSGKIVALIDERVFSNGEMMAHALKTLKRATLVGRPTAGGVLSTFNYEVLDWGEYRIPHGRWFAEDGTEMENHGAEPDVRVDDTPAEWARDVDSQLEKAIELAGKGDKISETR